LAEGAKIVADGKNTWTVDDKYQVTVSESVAASAKIRESAGKQELILPIGSKATAGQAELQYYLRW